MSEQSHRSFMQSGDSNFSTSVKQRLYARGLSRVKGLIRQQGGYLLPNSTKVLSAVFPPRPGFRQDPNSHLPIDVTLLMKRI